MPNSVYFSFPENNNISSEDIDTITPAVSTDNGVLLFNGIDGTAVKNSISFVQLPSGKVGIGTIAPTASLDVVGGVKATGTIATTSNATVGTDLTVTGNETVAKLGIGSAAVPTVQLEVNGGAKIGVIATNYSEFESDGTLVFHGDATVWDDIRVSLTGSTRAGAIPPAFDRFRRDLAGTSQGVYAYGFDKEIEEEVLFDVEIPHNYKLGTNLIPHVHWAVAVIGDAGKKVRWGLEYTICDIGNLIPVTQIIYTDATDPVNAYKHNLTNFTTINGATIGNVSTIMMCRLFRDATNINDNYDADAYAIDVGFHYEIDTIGSRTPTTK
jgi:hypothetical protein